MVGRSVSLSIKILILRVALAVIFVRTDILYQFSLPAQISALRKSTTVNFRKKTIGVSLNYIPRDTAVNYYRYRVRSQCCLFSLIPGILHTALCNIPDRCAHGTSGTI